MNRTRTAALHLAVAAALIGPAAIGRADAAPPCTTPVGSGNTLGSFVLARQALPGDLNLTAVRSLTRGSVPAQTLLQTTDGRALGLVQPGSDTGTVRVDTAVAETVAAGTRVCVQGLS